VVIAEPTQVRIGILTRKGDFHAIVVCGTLRTQGVECVIIETDRLSGRGSLSWSPSGGLSHATIRDVEDNAVDIASFDAVWWRRLTGDPEIPEGVQDEAARDLIIRDCRATLVGVFLTSFKGQWVSHPEATRLAENKVLQLDAAQGVGLRVPRTLVSQDPVRIRQFCKEMDYRVVAKAVAGTPMTPLLAGKITPEMLRSDASLGCCPAIYQELIPGYQHLRICCFGRRFYTAIITAERLDWRYPLDGSVEPFDLDGETERKLLEVLDALQLRMGIFDMKLAEDGEPVWFEINPQGQFLFLEGLCGMPLTRACAEFLMNEAAAARRETLTGSFLY
jgi:hypothetical protein